MPVFHKGERVESVRDKMRAAKFSFPGQTDGETIIAALIGHFGPDVLAIRVAEAVVEAAPDIPVLARKPARAVKAEAKPEPKAKEEEKTEK